MTTRYGTAAAAALLLLAAAGVARPLAAQVEPPVAPRERARALLPAGTFARIDALAREAEGDGIPGAPLFDKALEGVAKGIPAERILPAIAAQAERLRTVRTLLGHEAPSPAVVAGADALLKGVPPEHLRALGPAERTPMALLVLGDLVQAGVPAEEAVGVVREAVARQVGEQDLLSITPTVRRLLRAGRTPGAAVDAVRGALRDGRPVHRIPDIGRGGGGPGTPAPPGSEPVGRDRRTGGAGAGE